MNEPAPRNHRGQPRASSVCWTPLVSLCSLLLVLLHDLPSAESATSCFANNTELRSAVQAYVANNTNGTPTTLTYGYPINSWCVDNVTDLSFVFDNLTFNESISSWKTGKATIMAYMFRDSTFNQPIGQWTVNNVVNFTGMFQGARNFNQDLSSWNMSAAWFLTAMFDGGTSKSSFRQDLCDWGSYTRSFWNVTSMFSDTNCNTTADPNVTATPPGPFCFPCVNSTAPVVCSIAADCARTVSTACSVTCNTTSTCFTNTTNYCCSNRNATSAYVANVTSIYRATYCTNTTCLSASSCATSVATACNNTCNFTSPCFTNNTNFCCANRNATSAYVANVTATYRVLVPPCDNRIDCPLPAVCAFNVSRVCNSTCSFNSSCFVNASRACCTNATTGYIARVTEAYNGTYCAPSCFLATRCARRIVRSCPTTTCRNTTTQCFRRTIQQCCTKQNPTKQYQTRVRNRFKRLKGCRVECRSVEQCITRIANRCNETCKLQSSCFVNASNSCCNSGNLTSAYKRVVKQAYKEAYCGCNVEGCAVKAIRCSGINCAVNQVCFKNVTDGCCKPLRYTSDEFKDLVSNEIKRQCRRSCTPPSNPIDRCAARVRTSCRSSCSNKNKKCFRRSLQSCCVKGRISVWADMVMRRYNKLYCKNQRTYGLGLGLFFRNQQIPIGN